jgi:HAD superfamily hydrolase (TIGR01548 family)
VDGVLVDVSESFLGTVIETVKFFTGKHVTMTQVHEWKNRPGFNDDWKLSHVWVNKLGVKKPFEEVKRKFEEIYWGIEAPGNVKREKWLLSRPALRRLRARARLALFTGRTRRELNHTLDGLKMRGFFDRIVTAEDVKKGKPDPEGLLVAMGKTKPSRGIYVGDNVDDAKAARAGQVPFVGLLPYRSAARKLRLRKLDELGALVVLSDVRGLEGWLRKRSGI